MYDGASRYLSLVVEQGRERKQKEREEKQRRRRKRQKVEEGLSFYLLLSSFVPSTVYHNQTPSLSFLRHISPILSRARVVVITLREFARTDGEIGFQYI